MEAVNIPDGASAPGAVLDSAVCLVEAVPV